MPQKNNLTFRVVISLIPTKVLENPPFFYFLKIMFLLVCRLLELLRLICLIIVLLIKISVKKSYLWTCEIGQEIYLRLYHLAANKSLN